MVTSLHQHRIAAASEDVEHVRFCLRLSDELRDPAGHDGVVAATVGLLNGRLRSATSSHGRLDPVGAQPPLPRTPPGSSATVLAAGRHHSIWPRDRAPAGGCVSWFSIGGREGVPAPCWIGLRWELSASLTGDDSEAVCEAIRRATDAADRINERELIQACRDKYQSMLRSMDVGVCVCEIIRSPEGEPTDYRYLEANSAFMQQTGLTQPLEQTARQMMPDLEDHWIQLLHRVTVDGEPHRFLQRSAGTGRWSEVDLCRIDWGEGPKVMSIYKDVTDRRAAESALRESELRFRTLVESAPAMLWMNDGKLRCTMLSRQWRQFTGRGDEEGLGYGWADSVHPDDLVRCSKLFQKAAAKQAPFSFEYRIRRHDGVYRWGLDTGQPRFDDEGNLIGYVGLLLDITERRLAEEQLQQSKAEAEAANRLKDEFLANLSHELRTPLSTIQVWSSVLQQTGLDGEKARDGLAAIVSAVDTQKSLIDDLLDMSRITSGNLRLQRRTFRLQPLVRTAVESLRPDAEDKELQLDAALEDVGHIEADATRVRQILTNLLDNAVKFTPRGGRVAIQLTEADGAVTVQVSDTGIGIGPDFLPRIFERFAQADSSQSRSPAGLGLGLAIAKQLAELHGGELAAHSPGLGRGSTFTLTLPR